MLPPSTQHARLCSHASQRACSQSCTRLHGCRSSATGFLKVWVFRFFVLFLKTLKTHMAAGAQQHLLRAHGAHQQPGCAGHHGGCQEWGRCQGVKSSLGSVCQAGRPAQHQARHLPVGQAVMLKCLRLRMPPCCGHRYRPELKPQANHRKLPTAAGPAGGQRLHRRGSAAAHPGRRSGLRDSTAAHNLNPKSSRPSHPHT